MTCKRCRTLALSQWRIWTKRDGQMTRDCYLVCDDCLTLIIAEERTYAEESPAGRPAGITFQRWPR